MPHYELWPWPTPNLAHKEPLTSYFPTLCHVVNLSTGCLPSVLRKAIVTPNLKKPTLDRQQLKNYRPISNLPFLGLIEWVVSSQAATYMDSNNLEEPLQYAYRHVHSTETALLAVQDSFLRAIDDRKAVFLVMINMSAAFDTVDHGVLLQRLSDDFGLCGSVHHWFQSYLSNYRTSQVCVSGSVSTETQFKVWCPSGVCHGSPGFYLLLSHYRPDYPQTLHPISHICGWFPVIPDLWPKPPFFYKIEGAIQFFFQVFWIQVIF